MLDTTDRFTDMHSGQNRSSPEYSVPRRSWDLHNSVSSAVAVVRHGVGLSKHGYALFRHFDFVMFCRINYTIDEQAVRVATQYAPAPLLPVGAQAPRTPPSRRNVAVLSHAEYVPTLTTAAALRVKATLSKAAWWPWPLTFWPWKWRPCHVWRGLSLCQFWSS